VTLPEHIVQKYERGQIPPALFADLLRLEEEPWVQLLIERVCVHKLDYK
jgi:hypothetical protein